MVAGREIIHGDALLNTIRTTAREIDKVVGVTMGPYGRTIIMGKEYGGSKTTKDGVTAIKDMQYAENDKRALLSCLQETANTVNQSAGDGTTAVTVFTTSLLIKACTYIAGGVPAVKLQAGFDLARREFAEYIKAVSRQVQKQQEMEHVAFISSNGDEEAARIFAETINKVGKSGVATIDEGRTLKKIDYEITSGMSINQGYISSYFVTNTEKMIADLENAYIFLANKKLSSIQQILPVLESVAQSGRPLLIIAEDVESEALATLIVNKMRGGLKVCAIKAPGFGDRRVAMLEDIAILTNGQLITEELGLKPENITLSMLGTAKRVTVYKDKTVIVGGTGDKGDIDSRVEFIKNAIEESTSDYDKEKLRERIARLVGGVAVIKVGGSTEGEVKERKDRYEDALNATRAAVEEGIVPGGGVALYNARKVLMKLQPADEGEKMGLNIVIECLSACMCKILTNAGYNSAVIASKLDEANDPNMVFDIRTGQFVNAFEAGIIDPTKVARIVFETALSTAALVIGASVLLVDAKEDKNSTSGGGGGDRRGGGGAGGFGGDMDF